MNSETIKTYNKSAEAIAQHFQQYASGPARKEITQALALIGCDHVSKIVEIGCGAGKDAAVLASHCDWYQGFDPAERLIGIARRDVPEASFVVADALSYQYPDQIDIVFAFASMLHLDRDDFAATCRLVAQSLKSGGIFCLVLKEADAYKTEVQVDKFGERQFYFYNPVLVQELAGPDFEKIEEVHDIIGPEKKRWFTVYLRRANAYTTP